MYFITDYITLHMNLFQLWHQCYDSHLSSFFTPLSVSLPLLSLFLWRGN